MRCWSALPLSEPTDHYCGRTRCAVPIFLEISVRYAPRSCVALKSRMRRHARLPFEAQMQVSWKDPRGQVLTQRATCLDLSAEGARLEVDNPIPARTTINLHSARYGSLGSASVRHCVRQALKFSIGVEFTSLLALASQGRKRCLDELQPQAESRP
jgi:hypothetical protein